MGDGGLKIRRGVMADIVDLQEGREGGREGGEWMGGRGKQNEVLNFLRGDGERCDVLGECDRLTRCGRKEGGREGGREGERDGRAQCGRDVSSISPSPPPSFRTASVDARRNALTLVLCT